MLQTKRFIETRREEPSTRRSVSITTQSRENSIQSIAPTESRNVVVEVAPGGTSSTGQPQ